MYFSGVVVKWIAEWEYQRGWSKKENILDCFHMFYIIHGEGILKLDECEYDLKCGQLFICSPGHKYELILDKNRILKTIEAKFYIYNQELNTYFQHIQDSIDINLVWIKYLLEDSINEAINKSNLYLDAINVNIFTALFKILRLQKCKETVCDISIENITSDSNYKNIDFKKIFEYINENLNIPITLGNISGLVGLNPAYLCRVFREKYSVSPIQYVNILRLKKAKELLLHSELNITEIADIVGFQTVQYFSKYFKMKEKVSPLKYKERSRNEYLLNNNESKIDSVYSAVR